ncbi:hypothetical protein [Amycolatopsis sp. H20-H5]|uniref:hypothetical protein n=1 Tax=Amycolatopsis sp. H20-H5 TaxID=3046309 RepID=UPI002DBE888A|nr:hypothetical protein [Amycolatopsis sp. H20-H5]MEC3980492.1 hypothetical protein [Amycolatopsis sp. H20-H5]
MTDTAMTPTPATSLISPRMVNAGFAALRIGFGVNWLSNAIAKLIGKTTFGGGWFSFNLVDRDVAHGILQQAAGSTPISPLRGFYTDVVLANWGFFQWFLTFTELAIGIGLLFGIASRLASVGGLLLLTPIWIMLLGTNQYFWTYPLDVLPLVLLAIIPTGRVAGFDRALATRFKARWPF